MASQLTLNIWFAGRRDVGTAHLGLGPDAPPPLYGIVPRGGLSADGKRWVACKAGLFLSVRVLSRLFRRRFIEALEDAHRAPARASILQPYTVAEVRE